MSDQISDFHRATHDALNRTLESYHDEIREIDTEMRRLEQRRAVVGTTAAADVSQNQPNLAPEIAHAALVACW